MSPDDDDMLLFAKADLPGLAAPQDAAPQPTPVQPDWWRCRRHAAVSGRYDGEMTEPAAGRSALELRIDIDPRSDVSPVMNRVSGDIWAVARTTLPGRPPVARRTYRESWIVDAPQVRLTRCDVTIRGQVRFWRGGHAATTVEIVIDWSGGAIAPARVTFSEAGGAVSRYNCAKVADCFRAMTLEIDVCASVNAAPLMPIYDTHSHAQRPVDLPQRTLTIESAYREAGVCVTIRPDHTVIDDTAPNFASWSPAELHDAMETHFSQYGNAWPNWELWGLLAGSFDDPGVGGIMFDAAAALGGAGKAPERQGFAVFRRHEWFNNLVAGPPANQDQAQAMRQFLYTWVHEAGHAFNLLHSWNKARPDALAWMNYDWKYDQRNGAGAFWSNFRFRFDDDELIHIRHGDRAAVIMGGDPWSSGGHLEAPHLAMAQMDGEALLELQVRSIEQFESMEPVLVEIRLRNLSSEVPVEIDKRLSPEFGNLAVFIRRPDGRTVEYAPVLCALGKPEPWVLKPASADTPGADRYSREIFLSYGSDGFYFDVPGEYLIRAVYQGAGDMLVSSDVHRIRIGTPTSRELDRLAHDFFTHQVGLALYLGGSRSPWLSEGTALLTDAAERFQGSLFGTKVAMTLAQEAARDFFRFSDPHAPKLTQTGKADPQRALALTGPAVGLLSGDPRPAVNLIHGRLVRRRAEYHKVLGATSEAKRELSELCGVLANRGVNPSVVAWYQGQERSL